MSYNQSALERDIIARGRPDFFDYASCSGLDPELFYPISVGVGNDSPQTQFALSVCNRCSVRVDCLDYALKAPEEFGIWGGETQEDRAEALRNGVRNSRQYLRHKAGVALGSSQAA